MAGKQGAGERQKAIKDLVKRRAISDQQQLVELLYEHHEIETNQAVVSRDIRKLGIIKKMVKDALCYEMPNIDVSAEILKLALIDITHNESLIVIKTHPGLAPFVGDCVDECQEFEILGCLAGENIVFVTPRSVKNIHKIYEKICEKFHFKKFRIMKQYLGYFCAFMAAIFNGMIGIFSVKIMSIGLSPYAIAFYKCFIAFLIITGWLMLSRQFTSWLNYLKRLWWQIAVAAFFGFFVLYFFETAAYKYEKVTIVVFMLLGSALITTFMLSSVLDKKWLRWHDLISCILALAGLALIFGINVISAENYLGIFLALIAGIGYGAFLTLSPRFNIGSGLLVVNSLMLFGTLYLFIPFAQEGLVMIGDADTAILLLFLSFLPTVGGFLCTTKALTLMKSESVQLIELSEPVIALVLSFLFLNQSIAYLQMMGGLLLMVSIYVNLAFAREAAPQVN